MSTAAPPLPPPAAAGPMPKKPGRLYLSRGDYERFAETAPQPHEWLCGLGLFEDGEELGEVRPKEGYHDDGSPAVASYAHNKLVRDLMRLLDAALRGSGHEALDQCMEVRLPDGRGRFPDVLVAPSPPRFEPHPEGKELAVLDPVALIEVLSDSTESEDRGDKLEDYASIPTVTDYLLVAQDEMRVQHFRRPAGASVADGWRVTPHAGPDAAVTLAAPALTLPLADIYARLFPAA